MPPIPVEFDKPTAAGFDGELADEPRGHALAGRGASLLCGCSERSIGEVFDLWQAASRLQMTHETLFAGARSSPGVTNLVSRCNCPLGGEVEAAFHTGKDADEQVAHARHALGLDVNQVTVPADQQPDLDIEFDCAQIGAGSELVGDRARVARIGLVLAADRVPAGSIDRQAKAVEAVWRCRGNCLRSPSWAASMKTIPTSLTP